MSATRGKGTGKGKGRSAPSGKAAAAHRPKRGKVTERPLPRGVADLGKERRIRGALDELRALLDSGEVDPERTAAMLAGELETAPMSGDEETPTTIRAPRALLDRAEALVERLPRTPGSPGKVSRSTILRRALELGIAALEAEAAELPAAVGGDVRAELAELRARLDRLEARTGGAGDGSEGGGRG